jgi:NAD(P)H-flavin reductase
LTDRTRHGRRRDPLQLPLPNATIRTPRVRRVPAVIARISKLSHDTLQVVIACSPDAATVLPLAGQFYTLGVREIDRPRPYSIARAPCAELPGEHTFFIRLLPDGEISEWFRARDRTGSAVELGGPLGHFRLDDGLSPMICIAGGSGMSAIYAILEDACTQGVARDCYFFYGARSVADLYFLDEINTLISNWNPRHVFRFVPVLSAEPSASAWQGPRGFVSDAAVASLRLLECFDWSASTAFLCGPPPMIDAAIAQLIGAGLSLQNCRFDRFDDIRSPAPAIDNTRCVLCDECLLVKPVPNCIVETAQLEYGVPGSAVRYRKLDPSRTSGLYYNALFIDSDQCIRCGACIDACPHDAITPGGAGATRTLRQRG